MRLYGERVPIYNKKNEKKILYKGTKEIKEKKRNTMSM